MHVARHAHTVRQAIKEEKMEVTLSQLAERWNNIVWGMDPYKGGDVPLLKIAEEDFEALEVLIKVDHKLQIIVSNNNVSTPGTNRL